MYYLFSIPHTLSPASGASLDAIKDVIERLNYLANAVRQPSFVERDPMLQNHAGGRGTDDEDALFERITSLFVRGLFPETHEPLACQLAASVVYRRRRIIYDRRQKRGQSTRYDASRESSPGIILSSGALSASHSTPPPTLSEDSRSISSVSPPAYVYPQPSQPHKDTFPCSWCYEPLPVSKLDSPGWWE